jgi:flagellar hook-length control protein FliK
VSRHLEAMRMANGRGEISLQLNPESLGSVHVTIATKPEGVVAVILAETSHAQQAMEGAKEQLRAALENRGLRLSTLDVNVGQQAPNGSPFGFAGHSDTPQQRAGYSPRTRNASGFGTNEPAVPVASLAEVASVRSRSRLDYRA